MMKHVVVIGLSCLVRFPFFSRLDLKDGSVPLDSWTRRSSSTGSTSGIVYRIPCADCNKSYIGQTGRTLFQRLKEQWRAVENFDTDTSALADHIVKESWYINHLPDTLNRKKDHYLRCTYLYEQQRPHPSQY